MRFAILIFVLASSTPCFAQQSGPGTTTPAPAPAPSTTPTPGSLAPNYRPFRVDLSFGGATIPDQRANGWNMTFEPKFNFLDQVTGGFRVDFLISQSAQVDSDSAESEVRQQFIAAGLFKVDYYFNQRRVRPWVSAAVGRYALEGQEVGDAGDDDGYVEYKGGAYYGILAQAGLELAAFRVSVTYNHLFGERVVVVENGPFDQREERYSSSYATIEFGVRFGGGRIRGR